MSRYLLIISLVLVYGCNDTREIGPEALGYDFYPLVIGSYRVYEVEEIEYKIAGNDTSIFQLRETIFDSLISFDQTNYLIRREKRDLATDPWRIDSVWTVARSNSFLVVTENNVPFVKLSFPVEPGQEWDGNGLNSKPTITYYYQSVASSIIDSIDVNDHIRLIIEDKEPTIVDQDERSEVYARGIGLVSKDYLTLEFCTVDCNEIGEILSGRYLNQELIEIGNE